MGESKDYCLKRKLLSGGGKLQRPIEYQSLYFDSNKDYRLERTQKNPSDSFLLLFLSDGMNCG